MSNALAAIAAARHVGVLPEQSIAALNGFEGVKRRMERIGQIRGVTVYDDFAHHPTAIATTLDGLRKQVGAQRIFAVIEPRSNSMRMGVHKSQLAAASSAADKVFWYQPPGVDWDLTEVVEASHNQARLYQSVDAIIASLGEQLAEGDHVVIMSNGGFEGIHGRLLEQLAPGQ